jgi:ubiquinone/menaquinone biosynthesis C-methylase UbiE
MTDPTPPRPAARRDTYTHGHHDSVLRSHRRRTAENSAPHLLPHLRPGLDLLDVGCGPGTITLDLARRVAPGRVVGIDAAPAVLEEARAVAAASGGPRPEYREGDAYALAMDAGSFDVVHAHQVLQHLTDPVAALREMHRVLRPGGLLAVRDSDYAAFAIAPRDAALERWNALYHAVTARNGAQADAGRHLPAWVRAAGFAEPVVSAAASAYADPDDRAWWGGLWADRALYSDFAVQARRYGLASEDDLREISAAWRRWAATEDALIILVHGQVLARR